jgi:hypothetical protein
MVNETLTRAERRQHALLASSRGIVVHSLALSRSSGATPPIKAAAIVHRIANRSADECRCNADLSCAILIAPISAVC